MKKSLCSFIAVAIGFIHPALHATDYTDRAMKAVKVGDWNIVEFAADKQIIYKVATEALNQNLKETYLSFYLTTAEKM